MREKKQDGHRIEERERERELNEMEDRSSAVQILDAGAPSIERKCDQ